MYAWLVPRIVFPLHGRLTGRRAWAEYRQLRALQWESMDALETRSLAKVRAVVGHAMAHVPFYRERFREAGVRPETLRTLDALARDMLASGPHDPHALGAVATVTWPAADGDRPGP